MKYIVLILLSLAVFSQASDLITCQNHEGDVVDWWVMFKLPKDYNKGKQYIYFDSTPEGSSYRIYDDINDSPYFKTIEQVQEVTYNDRFALFWNDQLPNGKKNAAASYAHAKGAAAGNINGGFVVNHSLPRTYNFDEEGNVNLHVSDSQLIYGQHLFCVSLDAENLDKYAASLIIDRVYIIDNGFIPESLHDIYQNAVLLQNNKYRLKEIPYDILEIETIEGNKFTKFAKSKYWEDDIYREVVAPYLGSDMIFETWGRPLQTADCNSHYSIKSNSHVQMTPEISYAYTKDHSKYGITLDKNYICLGDINRMYSQYHRGGGTTCFAHQGIHDFIYNAFVEQQPCPVEDDDTLSTTFLPRDNDTTVDDNDYESAPQPELEVENINIFQRFLNFIRNLFN